MIAKEKEYKFGNRNKTQLLYSDSLLLLSVNNYCKNDRRLFENVDTETMLLPSRLRLPLAVSGRDVCRPFLTNRRPCL